MKELEWNARERRKIDNMCERMQEKKKEGEGLMSK
jgi:hypothetical protein